MYSSHQPGDPEPIIRLINARARLDALLACQPELAHSVANIIHSVVDMLTLEQRHIDT